jgi:hypothetical protein
MEHRAPFAAPRGLRSPHAQTIGASLRRPGHSPPTRRQRLELPDGDFVDLDVLEAPQEAPHLLLLHGLEGSSRSGYVLAVLRDAAERGWGATALNFRSCSGVPNRLLRSYHSGATDDPAAVLRLIRDRQTGPLAGIGFSLGGNVLLRLLAEQGDDTALDLAAAVSVPYDLAASSLVLDGPGRFTRLYRARFLRSLRVKALGKAARFPGHLDATAIRAVTTLRGFDDAVTAPVHGFADAADYYARCSSGPVLGAIARPTLLLSAADDPFVQRPAIPDAAADNPHLDVVLSDAGGHVGFLTGSLARPDFWAEKTLMAWIAGRLGVAPATADAGQAKS